ncbi:acyl-coenzyme A thioesterase THEM4-like isoform X1 [Carettochelys insculpta]|uniref:acyl-coenzyme A thioesterase THEM4-like isoform X1 n=1 Tax=Carettochelys insculpta TaxID=44489 RepID=UPI003EB97B9A
MWRNCVRLMWRLGHSAVLCPGIKVSRCRVIGGFIPAAPCSPLWNAVAWVCQSQRLKDYALPNSSWSQDMMNLYSRFLEMCKDGTWKRIPSYSTNVAHLPESLNVVSKKDWKETRLFPRNMDTEGVGFEYAMFFNPSEKRMVCLFQPGPYLEGPPGFAHGGSTATIIDSTVGGCAIFVAVPFCWVQWSWWIAKWTRLREGKYFCPVKSGASMAKHFMQKQQPCLSSWTSRSSCSRSRVKMLGRHCLLPCLKEDKVNIIWSSSLALNGQIC